MLNQPLLLCFEDIPDFNGSEKGLGMVIKASPHIIGHNIETVPRLYHEIRPQGIYKRSITAILGEY
jgi:lipoic acid synthetase